MTLLQFEIFQKNFILLNIINLCQIPIFTQNISEIKKFLKKNKKIIIKPINSYSGNDILLLSKLNLKLLNRFIKKHNYIMCQKYLSKIDKGDKRVFLINGKIKGAISRIPKKVHF